MGVRLQTFLLLTLAVIISIIAYVCWYSYADKQRMEEELHALAQNYTHAFDAEFQAVQERMLQLALFTANDNHVQELMAAAAEAVKDEGGGKGGPRSAAIREQLYRHLRAGIEELADNFDIVTLHFHLTPGALSFLRFHRPEEMGDRLDDVRPMVVAAGRMHQAVSGFEIGRYFAGVRAAAPIFAPADHSGEQRCVGVVEFGTPIDSLLEDLHAHRPWIHGAAFVNASAFKRDMLPRIYAAATSAHSTVRKDGECLHLSASTSEELSEFLSLPEFQTGLFQARYFRFSAAEGIYNAASVPLHDYASRHAQNSPGVGKVVIWQDISERIMQHREIVTSLIWYGVFLFLVLEVCIYVALYLVTTKLREELDHQRQLKRVSGKALKAVSTIGHVEQQPQIQLNRILQEQLRDAVDQLGAEMGIFISACDAAGEFRILAVSDMVWSTSRSAGRLAQAHTQLVQQGYIPLHMEKNILVEVMQAGKTRVLEASECSRDIIPLLPEGHSHIGNGLLVPIQVGDTTLGLMVLANRERGFGAREQIVARAYAAAAALLMHSDLREVERLSAMETARIKEELFRNLNHELRTPLNVINGMCQNLAETNLDALQTHRLRQISAAAERLTHLMEEVLLLAGLDGDDRAKLKCTPFRPQALIHSLIRDFERFACERGIEVKCECDDKLRTVFNGDSEKISLILRQLLGNAIKFSRDAEVLVTLEDLSETRAGGGNDREKCTLRFSVTDHGIGIAPEQHELIFEPFYQCDPSRVREYEGAGLGLSVARKLGAILGTEIKLHSEVGVGSTFYFDLTLECAGTDQSEAAPAPVSSPQTDQRSCATPSGTERELQELLSELEEPLLHSRPRLCNALVTRIEARNWPAWLAPQVDSVLHCMHKYRYPEALDLVHQLQIRLEAYLKTGAHKGNPAE
jgi:signal transduction histidine kinase